MDTMPTNPDEPTDHTRRAHAKVLAELPFGDREDFELARRGLIEATPGLAVGSNLGDYPCWDLGAHAFVGGEAPDTVNPSLWRLATLNMTAGLYQVTDGVYQVRGFDLANIAFFETEAGVVVLDALTSTETAAAALALYRKHRGERPIEAVIHSHSHVDHFAGIRGLVDPEQVARGEVRIVAPAGFLEEAASENVLAGNVMTRRASYMYGALVGKGPGGQVDAALGKGVSFGAETGLLAPTDLIEETGQEMTFGGLTFVFQLTPGTEAPAEMNFHVPARRLLCTAENANATMHNLYTLRGAAVRDARAWSAYLHQAWRLFGEETDVLLTVHHWPRWGAERIERFLRSQADLYKYLHDQTLRLANQGRTMNEIADELELPPSLAERWHNRGYYGSVSHNAKAIYQRYLGWFDGNPANLDPLPPGEAGARYVELMGGADAVVEKARGYFERGEYRWVAQVLSHVVFSEPEHEGARKLSAAAMRQLAFQTENATWRNFYLTGAQELTHGAPPLPSVPILTPDAIEALPTPMLFDFLAVHLDGPAADGTEVALDLVLPDTGERFRLELVNCVLNHFEGRHAERADAALTVPRRRLSRLVLGEAGIEEVLAAEDVSVEGDEAKVRTLFGLIEEFELWFGVVTPDP